MYATTGYHQRTVASVLISELAPGRFKLDGMGEASIFGRSSGAISEPPAEDADCGREHHFFTVSTFHPGYHFWLGVWNMNFIFHVIYGIILPIDFQFFQDGYCTTNQIDFIAAYGVFWCFLGGWTIGIFWQLGPRMMWLLNEERRQNVGSFLCTGRESAGMGKQGDLEADHFWWRNYLA